MHAVNRLQKLGTDLRIVLSGRIADTNRIIIIIIIIIDTFRSARFCGFSFSLLKLTRIIYCDSILHVKKILCHNDVQTNVVVAARVSLIQVAQLSQRDRTAGWVNYGQKWKTGTGRQYLRTM